MNNKIRLFCLIFTFLYLLTGIVAPVFADVNYTYDANGNMTSDGTNCYTYNDANQLSKVTNCSTGQTIAEYVYDYQGNRIEKKVYNSGSLQKTVYSPTKDYQTVKLASNGATQNTSYYYVNKELVAQKNPDGSKYYYLNDNLGSTSILTNQNGSPIENTAYLPFGQIQSGGTQSKYLYTGQENDSETNLDYYNARYYDPSIQHFTQPDSELPNVYDPQQLNRYSYVRNNPMTVTDPTGHAIWDELAGFLLDNPVTGTLLSRIPIVNTVLSFVAGTEEDEPTAQSTAQKVVQGINKVQSNQVVQKTENNAENEGTSKIENNSNFNESDQTVTNFRSDQNLLDHYNRHGTSMGYNTPEEYLNGARNLFNGGDGVDAAIRSDGESVYYKASTNEFGVIGQDNTIKTYYSPSGGEDYFLRDISK